MRPQNPDSPIVPVHASHSPDPDRRPPVPNAKEPDPIRDLLEMARHMREARYPGSALGAVTRTAQALTGSTQVTVRLLDSDEQDLLVAARRGEAMHIGGAGRFRADEGLIGWVVTRDQSVLVNDVASDQRFKRKAGQTWMPKALLAVPLRSGRHVTGVLSAARAEGPGYSRHELELLKLIAELAAPNLQVEQLRVMAERDPLTGLLNQRMLRREFRTLREQATREGTPLAAIMLDLDDFGEVNSTYGWEVGNIVLEEFTRRLREACRATDHIYRWGGEEFFVLLPHTSAADAKRIAERILETTRARPIKSKKGTVNLTASAGAAAIHPLETLAEVEEHVGDLARAIKRTGKNGLGVDPAPDYDFGSFFKSTIADWVPLTSRPARTPDFVSESGSEYWDLKDGVIRESDHWGPGINDCTWYLGGHETSERAVAYCAYAAFEPAPEG